MKTDRMDIQWRDIGSIKPYERNAKKHPEEQVQHIANSLQRFGWKQPLVVDKDGVVVVGHGRLLAAKKLGLKSVPCVCDDDLTEDEIKAFRLVDNKTNESAWDDELLELELDELAELDDIDMSDYGFELSDGGVDTLEASDDNYAGTVPDEPKSKVGDLYQLGEHRLICGNSTDAAIIDRLMDGVKADMVMTDAPYGVSAVNSEGTVIGYGEKHLAERGKYAPIIGDDTTETAQQAYDILSQICDKLILWGGNYFLDFLPASDGWLIWDKRGESGIRNNFADGEMAWCSFHTPVRIYHQLWNGMIREGEHEKRVHPTQKPIKMLSEILKDFSKENEVIVDVFGGSGSTLIACEQLNRKCYMAELNPKYIDVIIDRWETFTGEKAVLLNAS